MNCDLKQNLKIRQCNLIHWTFGIKLANQYIKGKIDQITELHYKGQNSFIPKVLSYFFMEVSK